MWFRWVLYSNDSRRLWGKFFIPCPHLFPCGPLWVLICLVLLNFLFYDLSNISYLKLKLIKKKKKNSSSSILKPYKIRIFFCCFERWWEGFLKLNWKSGLRLLGQYGMLGTNFISSTSNFTQEQSSMAPFVS